MVAPHREFLLDVSRLLWRLWSGRLPTGIDRVCLEYVQHFAGRSLAVIQFRGRIFVLPPKDSDRLCALIVRGGAGFRPALLALAIRAFAQARRGPLERGMIYLNVGHTGLNHAALPEWIERHHVKAVYLIHDLIPITHPQFCRPGEAEKHERRIANALLSATGVVANSRATLDDVANFASERGLPMPPATVAWISGPNLPDQVAPRKGPSTYFVTLGTIEGRRNHILLVRVWQSLLDRIGDSTPQLVIIGQRGWEADEVTAVLDNPGELRNHIVELGDCGDTELASWLAGARALLMPSFAEGFGLPVIEALEVGTPVIASDLPVYREIVGDIPTYLDPLDQPAWEQAVGDFMGDAPERRRQLAQLEGYRAPDWRTHFNRVEEWMQRL